MSTCILQRKNSESPGIETMTFHTTVGCSSHSTIETCGKLSHLLLYSTLWSEASPGDGSGGNWTHPHSLFELEISQMMRIENRIFKKIKERAEFKWKPRFVKKFFKKCFLLNRDIHMPSKRLYRNDLYWVTDFGREKTFLYPHRFCLRLTNEVHFSIIHSIQ